MGAGSKRKPADEGGLGRWFGAVAGTRIVEEPSTAIGRAFSTLFADRDAALGFARDLREDGITVLRLEGGNGVEVMTREEVEAWCKARPRRRVKRRSPSDFPASA